MKTVNLSVAHKGQKYGPYSFISFESLKEAVDFYGSEEIALVYLNKGSLTAQQHIARTMASNGASPEQIAEAIATHRPRVPGAKPKKRDKAAEKKLITMLAMVEDRNLLIEAMDLWKRTSDANAVIELLRSMGIDL